MDLHRSHTWCFRRHASGALTFTGDNSQQITLSHFKSGCLRRLFLDHSESVLPTSAKCNSSVMSSEHRLQCTRFCFKEAVTDRIE
ncbi:hypothetical protein AVEN_233177-1 [Araneus ventricosus]|uniref:Uncharacterized protein n=1 Tax=Araneus ventricosus TaxID=182803 RepID=A0A4Y2EHM0_ARAVE|nr:hypothetical protein AVEN_233177-1 [Araneus ventricosus]